MESQLELNEERLRLRDKLIKVRPALMRAEQAVLDEVYRDGALSAKMKRLIAMCVALGTGCTNCILGQTLNALDKGATKEELLEALSVVIAIRGTTGIAESLRVIKLLEEKGIL
jgi:AhpD family alkylhydroperoxidase